ncbi:hypothetical protein D1872_270180 [compost metagenome]
MAVPHIRAVKHGPGFILPAEVAASQRNPGQYAQVLPLAGRENPLLRRTVQPVVNNLNHLRIDLGRSLGLMQVVIAADRCAEMADFSGLNLLVQRRPQFVIIEGLVRPRVELVQVDIIRLQRF